MLTIQAVPLYPVIWQHVNSVYHSSVDPPEAFRDGNVGGSSRSGSFGGSFGGSDSRKGNFGFNKSIFGRRRHIGGGFARQIRKNFVKLTISTSMHRIFMVMQHYTIFKRYLRSQCNTQRNIKYSIPGVGMLGQQWVGQ